MRIEMTGALQDLDRRQPGCCFCQLLRRMNRLVEHVAIHPLNASLEVLGTIYFFNIGLLDSTLGFFFRAVDGISSVCTDEDNSYSFPSTARCRPCTPCTARHEENRQACNNQAPLKSSSSSSATLNELAGSFDLEPQQFIERCIFLECKTPCFDKESFGAGASSCQCYTHRQHVTNVGSCSAVRNVSTGTLDASNIIVSKSGRSKWRLFVHVEDSSHCHAIQWSDPLPSTSSISMSMPSNVPPYSSEAACVITIDNHSISNDTIEAFRKGRLRERVHYLFRKFDLHLDFLSDAHLTPYSEISRELSYPSYQALGKDRQWPGDSLGLPSSSSCRTISVKDGSSISEQPQQARPLGNIIFIHGIGSSSNFWRDTIFPCLSKDTRTSYKIFCPDLLGLGCSPRPKGCQYTVDDHVEAVRHSVIEANGLESYHLVGHSMGCKIALALAVSNPSALCSLTLLSPANWELGGKDTLMKLAPRKLVPPHTIMFSSTWYYPNVARFLTNMQCPRLMKLILRQLLPARYPTSLISDFVESQSPFHMVWSTFWNTLVQHKFGPDMGVLQAAGQRVRIIHGMDDPLCPFECSMELAEKYSVVSLLGVPAGSHELIIGREIPITREIEKEIRRGTISLSERVKPHVKASGSPASSRAIPKSDSNEDSHADQPGSPPLPLSYCVQC